MDNDDVLPLFDNGPRSSDLKVDPNAGVDLGPDDPLPDIPDAGPDSIPITSPDPLDFTTKGITGAGAVGMSTFNDGDDQTFFERTADAFEESGAVSPTLIDEQSGSEVATGSSRARIYG